MSVGFWIGICRIWSSFIPGWFMEFFYHNTLFLVLVTWAVFLYACKFHRDFAFSKPMLVVFLLFVAFYSVYLFSDALKYVDMLFPNEKLLIGNDIIGLNERSLLVPEPGEYYPSRYPLDGSYYNVIEKEMGNRIADSIFLRLATSIPTGVACIVYDFLFVVSLVRNRKHKEVKGVSSDE